MTQRNDELRIVNVRVIALSVGSLLYPAPIFPRQDFAVNQIVARNVLQNEMPGVLRPKGGLRMTAASPRR